MRRYLPYILFLLSFAIGACIQTSTEPDIVRTQILPSPAPLVPPETFNLQTGAAIFAGSCAPCHGETGLGDGPTSEAFTCTMPQFPSRSRQADLVDWYKIVLKGKPGDQSCLMPPWNRRLNEEQMWNVAAYAYSLRYGDTLESGESLLETYQTGDPSADLSDSLWQADSSDADLLSAIGANRVDGFDFSEVTEVDDQFAVLAGLRTFVFDTSTESTFVPTAQPTEIAALDPTPSDDNGTPSGQGATPAPETESEDTFTINGTAVSGTEGVTLPEDLELVLRVVAINAEGQPEEIYNANTQADSGGKFTFSGIPRNLQSLALIYADYAGVRQFSDQIFPGSFSEDSIELTFNLYETTDDPSGVQFLYVESLIDAVTAESASEIFQNFEITSTADRIYIGGEDGRTVKITLPVGAIGPQIRDAMGSLATRFELVREEDHFVIYDSNPVIPGVIDRVTVRYNFAYPGSMKISQKFDVPVEDLSVFISESRGLELDSTQFILSDSAQSDSGVVYTGFTLQSPSLAPGETVTYRIFDGPIAIAAANAAQPTEQGSFLQENSNFVLGLGVLLVIAGGMFLLYDLQKTRLMMQGAGELGQAQGIPTRRDDLIAEIAALDEAYESGEVNENTYQRRRESLKEALRRKLE